MAELTKKEIKDLKESVNNAKPQTDIPSDEETALAVIDDDYLKRNRGVGLEEVTPDDLPTPTLSLIQNNSTLTDDENKPYPRGEFFYKGNSKTYKEIICTLLSFTKQDLPDFSNREEMVKNYIFLGVLEDEGFKPFKLFLKRTGIGAAKQFLGAVAASNLPMFALKVVLTAEYIQGELGNYYKIKFTVKGKREDASEILQLEKMARQYGPLIKEEPQEEAEVIQEAKEEFPPPGERDKGDIPF